MTVSLIEPNAACLLVGTVPKPVFVDARPRSHFEVETIAGAVSLDWEEWCEVAPIQLGPELQQPGYWGVLTGADSGEISSRLSALGITNDGPIIVFADGPFSKGREGRIAWMLAYWGARDVRLLNGGFTAWKQAGLPVLAPSPLAGSIHEEPPFQVILQHKRRSQLHQLLLAGDRGRMPVMLDTRTHKEFVGLDYRYMPRMGCVPDSLLLPHSAIFSQSGRYLRRDDFLRSLPGQVIDSDDTVAYCEVGVRACNVSLLFEIYTGQIMPVYDGSMMEWSADISLPVQCRSA